MQVSKLLDDDAGVSPVIGVILMVAITVILAAVIGTFVLNNNNLNNTAPQVNWDYSFDAAGNTVDITHEGGDDVEASNLKYTADGGSSPSVGYTGTVSAGDSDTGVSLTSGETLRIIWTSPEGGSSSTIGQYEAP